MPRKLVNLTLVAARKSELAGAWARLGFALSSSGDGVLLADGARLDFFAPDDGAATGVADLQARAFLAHFATRRAGAALVGFSGEADGFLSGRPQPFDGAECFFQLAARHGEGAPAHANGVLGVKAVVAVADDPADHAEFLSNLIGQREMLATSAGLEMKLEGVARFDVLTPPAFAFRFGAAAPEISAFRIAGLMFGVKNLGETEKMLQMNCVEAKMQSGRLLAGPREGAGVAVAFEQD
jgi:hypothetical protein